MAEEKGPEFGVPVCWGEDSNPNPRGSKSAWPHASNDISVYRRLVVPTQRSPKKSPPTVLDVTVYTPSKIPSWT